ncbi:MAG: response regulator [Acidobacteria bacterium]|nr:response regulator [Acidobacteriota bacterium]
MAERSILLIEDDPSDARLIQRAFGKLDRAVAVIRLTHGDDAVAYLSGEVPYENRALHPLPCVVLLDIKLPRRSGFEVLQWLRRQETGLRRLPVVMLTSSRHSADINRAYDLGANSYLSKPETSAKLQNLVASIHEYWKELNEGPDLHVGAPVLR